MFKDYDYRFQKNRDRMIWTDHDLWLFFAFGAGAGLLVGFLLGVAL